MKGLLITRGIDQELHLFVDPGISADELHRQLADGITIRVSDISRSWARLHIQAPPALHIIRPDSHSKINREAPARLHQSTS